MEALPASARRARTCRSWTRGRTAPSKRMPIAAHRRSMCAEESEGPEGAAEGVVPLVVCMVFQ